MPHKAIQNRIGQPITKREKSAAALQRLFTWARDEAQFELKNNELVRLIDDVIAHIDDGKRTTPLPQSLGAQQIG